MRIALVITKGELGGAQTHVAELCAALRQRCDFLALIGGPRDSALQRTLSAIGIPVEPIAALGNAITPLALLSSIDEIGRAARGFGADVIHVHSAVASAVGRMAGWLSRIPVVYTVHGFAFKPQVPRLRRFAALAGERVLAPFSTHFICVSDAERALASRLHIASDKVSVISNGVADSALRARPGEGPARLVMVARMAPPKRHDLLLKAHELLVARGCGASEVLLAGTGPLAQRWHDAARHLPAVRFCGDVGDVPTLLARSHAFVLLSDHEGQPISVIEAMRAGLPVVASDLPGIRGQVTHGVEGLLVAPEPVAIADALQFLICNPAVRARMGAAARLRYEKDFSAEAMGERVSRVYVQAAAARLSGRARPA